MNTSLHRFQEAGKIAVCIDDAFRNVKIDQIEQIYWSEVNELLCGIVSGGNSWKSIPFSYFNDGGSDTLALATPQELVFTLPSALCFSLDLIVNAEDFDGEAWVKNHVAWFTITRLERLASAQSEKDVDFHVRRRFTIHQAAAIFLFLSFAAESAGYDEASSAIHRFWGKFEGV